MEFIDLLVCSNAEKIILAEQLWDSVSKNEVELTNDIKKELNFRIKKLEEGKSVLYSWNDVKQHLKQIRNV